MLQFKVRPAMEAYVTLSLLLFVPFTALLILTGTPAADSLAYAAALTAGTVGILAQLRATITLDGDNIRIHAMLTSFCDRIANLQAPSSEKFNFRADRRFGLKHMFRGTRLPGFHVGWFVLRDGSTAYVCVSRKTRARMLTTRDGCRLLLDPNVARKVEDYLAAC